jgi:hypothetical protein
MPKQPLGKGALKVIRYKLSMQPDQTPINARASRRAPRALEGVSLALRDRLVWPLEDRFLGLGDRARVAVAGSAAALALGIGVGGFALLSSGDSGTTGATQVAASFERAPDLPAPTEPEPVAKPRPEPTLHGAAPAFAPPGAAGSEGGESPEGTATADAPTGDAGATATDAISSTPAARPTTATASSSGAAAEVDGPPAGPVAIAAARKFAAAFVVYETGGEEAEFREVFDATATPELVRALLDRPPRQPAGVEVPKAKVLNVVPAPSHGRLYPLSVSLLRVGVTSELRLEMERQDDEWRVVNVLG